MFGIGKYSTFYCTMSAERKFFSDLTTNEAVVDEIRSSLRHMVAILVQRASKVINTFVITVPL